MNLDFATPSLLFLLPVVLALALMPWYAGARVAPAAHEIHERGCCPNALTQLEAENSTIPAFAQVGRAHSSDCRRRKTAVERSARDNKRRGRGHITRPRHLRVNGGVGLRSKQSPRRRKDVISEFVQQREYDRIGIVVFASVGFRPQPANSRSRHARPAHGRCRTCRRAWN